MRPLSEFSDEELVAELEASTKKHLRPAIPLLEGLGIHKFSEARSELANRVGKKEPQELVRLIIKLTTSEYMKTPREPCEKAILKKKKEIIQKLADRKIEINKSGL